MFSASKYMYHNRKRTASQLVHCWEILIFHINLLIFFQSDVRPENKKSETINTTQLVWVNRAFPKWHNSHIRECCIKFLKNKCSYYMHGYIWQCHNQILLWGLDRPFSMKVILACFLVQKEIRHTHATLILLSQNICFIKRKVCSTVVGEASRGWMDAWMDE